MSAQFQPDNRNFLAQFNYKFFIKKLPHVNYFGQGINLPAIALPAAEQPTPFVAVPWPGDHIKFDDLTIKFIVDEELNSWLELFDWMCGLGFPDSYKQYADLKANKNGSADDENGGIFSAASLFVTSNARNLNLEFEFQGLWPTALSGLEFNTTDNDVQFITATAIFRYTQYIRKKA